MKKKLVTICLFFLTFYFYSNDFGLGLKNVNENRINVPHRYFEFNTTVNAGASNNYFAAEDILVEELIFDLKKNCNRTSFWRIFLQRFYRYKIWCRFKSSKWNAFCF